MWKLVFSSWENDWVWCNNWFGNGVGVLGGSSDRGWELQEVVYYFPFEIIIFGMLSESSG